MTLDNPVKDYAYHWHRVVNERGYYYELRTPWGPAGSITQYLRNKGEIPNVSNICGALALRGFHAYQ